jgi:hypothetical protein
MSSRVGLAAVVALLFVLPTAPIGLGATEALGIAYHAPLLVPASGVPAGAFAMVTNFEDLKLDGWTTVAGTATISTSVTYRGEPSIASTAGVSGPQVDRAQHGFLAGDSSLSFQAYVNYGAGGGGFVGLVANGHPVAVVGVRSGSVWAGPSLSSLTSVGTIPTTGTAQPAGWVDLMATINASQPSHPASAPLRLDV